MGGGATPSLSDTSALTMPDGVYLYTTLAMVQGDHKQLRVGLATLFGTDHSNMLEMKETNIKIIQKEIEL